MSREFSKIHYRLNSLFGIGFLAIAVVVISAQSSLAQTKEDCLMCHSDSSLTTERNGKEVSLYVDGATLEHSAHRKLVCVACHVGFNPEEMPHKEKITPVNCLTCHKNAALQHAFHPQMVKAIGTNGSPDISCKDCHGTHNVAPLASEASPFYVTRLTTSCGSCHPDVMSNFESSAHGRALASHLAGAPTCLTCHKNDIVQGAANKDSVTVKITQVTMCLSCHLDDPQVRARMSPTAGFILTYDKSVHGAALMRGDPRAANCVDCHGSHQMSKGGNPESRVNKAHIPETCSTCHPKVYAVYKQSIHGVAAASGNRDAPVCTDCHGEHNILPPSDPNSPVAATNVSVKVCSPCHSSVKFSEKYGLQSNRFRTFSDSFHGLAIRSGDVEVANCASCHGYHNIKPSSDPTSSTNKANLAVTCGGCHPGANERFAIGKVHVDVRTEEEPALYWLSTAYIILIVLVVGGMFAHNLLDFITKSTHKIKVRKGLLMEEPQGHGLYLRMTLSERIQHGSLMASFVVLVITGFMLHYPDAWWVVAFRSLSDNVFQLRGLIHRVAGVVMVMASLYHVYYVLFTGRGKQLVRDLLPRPQDVREAYGMLKFNMGLTEIKPKLGRFSYVEKAEYWALIWGTIVMAATGVILWFDNTFLGLLTKLGWDIARYIHFYEAWLATLSIIVWHFYFVLLNPDIYPMNTAWITGTLSESEMRDEHPRELEEILRREAEGQYHTVDARDSGINGGIQ
jgi:cytochrome b subunit of formate dehydrogenase/nitrate reductase cytochrome c-type subunit